MNKEVKQFLRKAKRQGWTFETTSNGHVKLMFPGTKAIVFMPGTPGDHRTLRNTERDMRRAMRGGQ